jgi:hypothetical protein
VYDTTPSGAVLTEWGAKWWNGSALENQPWFPPPAGTGGCYSQGKRDKCSDYDMLGRPTAGWSIPEGIVDIFKYDYGWGIPMQGIGFCEFSGAQPGAFPIAYCSDAFKAKHFLGDLVAAQQTISSVRESNVTSVTSEVNLFDGSNLTDWVHHQTGFPLDGNPFSLFRVVKSNIEVNYDQSPYGMYSTLCTKQAYSAYTLSLEFQYYGVPHKYTPTYKWGWLLGSENSSGRNSGIFIHADKMGNNRNVEVNLYETGEFVYNNDMWYTVNVVVDGATMTAGVTGVFSGDSVANIKAFPLGGGNAFAPATSPNNGHICLQNEYHPIRFRNVKLNSLT